MKEIGKIIKLERKKLGITQRKLCVGICSNSYLSKIENEKIIADNKTIDLLLNRLGIIIDMESNKIISKKLKKILIT